MRWLAICSTPAAQPRVCMALEAYEHEAFAPSQTFWKRYRAGERHKAFAPLFAGYTFVRTDPCRIGELLEIEGVRDVMRSPAGKPLAIPDETINALRRAVENHVFDRTRQRRIPPGTSVRIISGPLAGLIGKIASASAKHRPHVLLRFLGELTETEVPIDKLEQLGR